MSYINAARGQKVKGVTPFTHYCNDLRPMLYSLSMYKEKASSLEASFQYCKKIATEHYENFPVGSWILPKEKRRYIYAVYAFARQADDFADEKIYKEEDRLQRLTEWEERLKDSIHREPEHPVFIALRDTIERFEIPVELLKDLLKAFKMDIVNKRYKRLSDLLTYCSFSANPVGRIVLLISGHKDPELCRLSDFICTALQLTNFWQDIAVDLEKDRIYIPLEDIERFGYTVDEIKSHVVTNAFRRLMAEEIEFTRGLFVKGLPLCSRVDKRLSIELRAICLGGMMILEKIEKNGYAVFDRRPTINGVDKVKILSRALTMRHYKDAKYI